MRYSISYDLVTPGKNYQSLWDALYSLGAIRILASQWLVTLHNTTPLDIAKSLVAFMDDNDRIFVTEVPGNFAYRSLIEDPKAA